ncbi:putative UDP-glycosyltransferase 79B6-like isoform 1 [Capsicum annuum]|nr:putative UDP-glycosyltransferase 79B6-like isoform 1 [Capsicum annuum]
MEMDTVPNDILPSSTTTTTPAVTPTSAAISPNTPSSKLNHLSESLKLEHQFLRVPFEHYKKMIRANQRVVEKEVNAVINGVIVDDSDVIILHQLNSLISRLQGLKRKLYRASTSSIGYVSLETPLSKLNQLAESMKLEHQFLRVSFEHYKKTIRANHRVVEKEVNAVINGVIVDADDSDLYRSPASSVGYVSLKAPLLKLNQLSESMKLEHQFLRVPCEHYMKTIRANHHVVEKEVNAIINGFIVDVDDSDVIMSSDDAVHQLNSLVLWLQGLKRKFLRVPFEHYKKTIHANHRVVKKDVSVVVNGVIRDDGSDVMMSSDDAVH